MPTREKAISASIAVLNEGGPPLLGTGKSRFSDIYKADRSDFYPIGAPDDEGVYLYLPILGNLFSVDDPQVLNKWLFIGLFAAALIIYPLIFYLLFGSVAVGVVSPFLLLFVVDKVGFSDVDFMQAWAALVGLPVIFLLYKRWPKHGVLALALLMVVASFATSIRVHAGLPILLAAIILVIMQKRRWWKLGLILVLLVLSYLSIYVFAFEAVRAYRDHRVDYSVVRSISGTYRSLYWHSIYIGLGFQENDYGIRYKDEIAMEHALRENPRAEYFTPEYETTIRKLYLRILAKNPEFVITTMAKKSAIIVSNAVSKFWLALIFIPAMLLLGGNRRLMRRYVMLAIPAAVVFIIPPVLTIPKDDYQSGWIGAIGLLWLLCISWVTATGVDGVIQGITKRKKIIRSIRDSAKDLGAVRKVVKSTRVWAAAALIAIGLVAGVVISGFASSAKEEWNYLQNQSALMIGERETTVDGQAWEFKSGLPRTWESHPEAVVRPTGKGIYLETGGAEGEWQMAAREKTLKEGKYQVELRGSVEEGGLRVGVVDMKSGEWIVRSRYWHGQPFGPKKIMVSEFTLKKKTPIRIALVNWAKDNSRSKWEIESVRITDKRRKKTS